MLKRCLLVVLVVCGFGAYTSTRAQQPASTSARGLVGSWMLTRAERLDGPAPTAIQNPHGLIIFDSAGHVVEVNTRGGRQPYAANQPTPEEALGAFNTFGGFWGTYRADEKSGSIEYHTEAGVSPSLKGQELVRGYELKGDRLVITSRPGDSGVQGTMRWTWELVPAMENLSPAYRSVLGFWQWVGEKVVATATGETVSEGKRDPSIIVYAPSGLIGVHFVPADRKPLAGQIATPEEARASVTRYVGYTAVLTLYPGEVIHHQLVTIAPGGGALLRRWFELKGDELHLKFRPTTVQGQERQTQVTLRRLSGAAEMLGGK
jgi:hypothetical protein